MWPMSYCATGCLVSLTFRSVARCACASAVAVAPVVMSTKTNAVNKHVFLTGIISTLLFFLCRFEDASGPPKCGLGIRSRSEGQRLVLRKSEVDPSLPIDRPHD